MRAAVAVITWNGSRHIGPCLDSVAAQTLRPDVLVLDNASADDTVEIAHAIARRAGSSWRVVREATNWGYTGGANRAMRTLLSDETAYDLIALLNQDVTLAPRWLASVQELFARAPDVGAVGSKTFYPDGITLQHAGGYLTEPRLVGAHYGQQEIDDAARYDVERDVEFVTGAAIAFRVACLDRVGLLDEIFAPGYYDDVDLCARMRVAGWRVVYCPTAQACHVESASFSDRFERVLLSHRNRLIFAVDRLVDRDFADRFQAAERSAFAEESLDVLRTLALAYFQVSIRLDEIAHARLSGARLRRSLVQDVGLALSRLRDECLGEIRRRRLAGRG
jgi:GT2 family glycosyltransferase